MKNLLILAIVWSFFACSDKAEKPNIVLIMADDMGYECLSVNGATQYHTPNLDRLSKTGLRFTNAFSQPLCTPSRVKLMTGKHNYRNYEYFGYLNPNQKTFGNLMKDAGYKTCISGKWQLNGLSFDLPGQEDVSRPHHFGFDEYCLWQLNRPKKDGERYADPLIYQNGEELTDLEDKYGPDIFSDFVCDFIDRNSSEPFFVYYPMVLVHDPFVPTPDSQSWSQAENRYEKDTAYFKDMMAYTDKIVGKIERKLIDKGIDKNTILIFLADNGTNVNIVTQTEHGPYPGGKSFTTQRGIHVPMIANWPGQMKDAGDYDGIVDFADFYPTLAEIAGVDLAGEMTDGLSFYRVLKGDRAEIQPAALIHYDPEWGGASKRRNRFALTEEYKLYRDGRFYNHAEDIDEQHAITDYSQEESEINVELQKLIDKAESESPWIVKEE